MSFYSNHEPESIDACRFDEDPTVPEEYGRTTPAVCCNPSHPDQMCPGCRSDYEAWLRDYDAVVDILPEPCGQQFADGPLPPGEPF